MPGERRVYGRGVSENKIYLPRGRNVYHPRRTRGSAGTCWPARSFTARRSKRRWSWTAPPAPFDLGPASELGQNGLLLRQRASAAARTGKKFALSGRWEPELACSFPGADAEGEQVQKAWQLARSIMETRDLVNCPANLLRPEMLAQKLKDMADGLPIEAELYDRQALERLGLRGLLTVGDSSAYAPAMVVLRYTGAPDCGRRLGLVGKGVTVDTGGYCLKPASSMAGIKGDMAGGRRLPQRCGRWRRTACRSMSRSSCRSARTGSPIRAWFRVMSSPAFPAKRSRF